MGSLDDLVAAALRQPPREKNVVVQAETLPVLSIMIPSLRCRHAMLLRLLARLTPQLNASTELLVSIDDGASSVGTKRNQLLDAARAAYVCFVDDDDLVSDNYVDALVNALDSKPDAVGFMAKRYHDGEHIGEIRYSLRYSKYGVAVAPSGKRLFTKPPNHLCPIRADLAREVRFRSISVGEDVDYAMRLRPLLRTEAFVDQELYEYYYVSRKQ